MRRVWWPRPTDAALAALLCAVVLVATVLSDDPDARPWWPGGAILVAAASTALAWRHRAPLAVLVAVAAAVAPYYWLGFVDGPASMLLAVAVYTVASRLGRWRSVVVGLLLLAVWVGVEQLLIVGGREVTDEDRYLWLVVTVALGLAVGALRRAASEAAASAEEQARRRVEQERLRVAREVHDVVSHGLASIAVQAGVGLHVADRRPEEAAAALREIRDVSRAALAELRAVLDVVRDPEAEVDPRGLDRLPEVTRVAGLAGLDVEVRGSAGPLAGPVDDAAYRIVREAVTNVVRHARDARRVVVELERDAGELRVRVVDDGAPALRDRVVLPGHGLRGLAEHAAALGGRSSAGPLDAGGFVVEATLPLTSRIAPA